MHTKSYAIGAVVVQVCSAILRALNLHASGESRSAQLATSRLFSTQFLPILYDHVLVRLNLLRRQYAITDDCLL
jgi:hypothetical protein